MLNDDVNNLIVIPVCKLVLIVAWDDVYVLKVEFSTFELIPFCNVEADALNSVSVAYVKLTDELNASNVFATDELIAYEPVWAIKAFTFISLLCVYVLNEDVSKYPLASNDEVCTGTPLTNNSPCTLTEPDSVWTSDNSSPNWLEPLLNIIEAVSYTVVR